MSSLFVSLVKRRLVSINVNQETIILIWIERDSQHSVIACYRESHEEKHPMPCEEEEKAE